jgi:RNA polymerase sigma-70 factor (family 1)
MDNVPIHTLVERVARGDEEAMRSLFGTYYPRLVFFAEAIISDREEARDMAQEALLELWQQRATFAGQHEGNVAAYLFTIVRRDCYDYLRHQRVQHAKQTDIIAAATTPQEDVAAQMIYLEVLHKIYQEINHLPAPLARMMTLSFIEGLSTEEIAERLQMTPNHVRVTKSRALEKLRSIVLKQNLLTSSPALLAVVKNFFTEL